MLFPFSVVGWQDAVIAFGRGAEKIRETKKLPKATIVRSGIVLLSIGILAVIQAGFIPFFSDTVRLDRDQEKYKAYLAENLDYNTVLIKEGDYCISSAEDGSYLSGQPSKKDGTEVTKNVSLTFEGESYKEITLVNAIPIGTAVTVNEVPTGMGYELVSKSPSEAVTIQPKPRASQADTADSSAETPAVATVTFTNSHVGPGGGSGVLNHFTYIGNNDFAWSQYSDSSEAYPVTAGNG